MGPKKQKFSPAFAGAELLLERGKLLVGESVGAGDFGGHLAALGGGDHVERANHRRQLGDAAVLGQHAEEAFGQLAQAHRLAEAGGDPADLLTADFRVADQRAQLGRFAQARLKRIEVRFDRGDGARLAREVEQGRGVAPCQAGLNTGGKLHAKGSSWVRRNRFRACRVAGAQERPRQGWRAPNTGPWQVQPESGRPVAYSASAPVQR